jgi:hypothetical protein
MGIARESGIVSQHTRLWRITAYHMCCGFEENDKGIVVRAASIIWWAKGKRRSDVVSWALRRGYEVAPVDGK